MLAKTKILFIGFCLFQFCANGQDLTDSYGGKLNTIDNYQLNLKNFVGKKIILATFDASRPSSSFLTFLDSLNLKYYNSATLIAVPVNDFGPAVSKDSLLSLIRLLHLSYPILQITAGKRGSRQNSMLKWSTTASGKNHFNSDLQDPNRLYIISSSGYLYAVLPGSAKLPEGYFANCLAIDPNE